MKTDTYLDKTNQYIKTEYDRKTKTFESYVYPFTIIDKKTDLVSIDIAKGKLISKESGKPSQIEEFHKGCIFKLATLDSLEKLESLD